MSAARPYLAVASARARTQLQYRAAALAGAVTQVFWGFLKLMVLRAWFASVGDAAPMGDAEVAAYVWLGQAFFALIPWRIDAELLEIFRKGQVAHELLRPVDLWTWWWSRHLAHLVTPATMRAGPVLVIGALAGGLTPPASWPAAGAFVASGVLGVLLSGALLTVALSCILFTTAPDGVVVLNTAACFLFSGMLFPLPLFPDWVQPLVAWTPWRLCVDAPFRLYSGHLGVGELAGVLGAQLGWLVALTLLGRALIAQGRRRLAVMGG